MFLKPSNDILRVRFILPPFLRIRELTLTSPILSLSTP